MTAITEVSSKEWVKKYENVEEFLAGRKESTKKQYRTKLKKFFHFFGISPYEFLEEAKKNKVKTKTKLNIFYKHLLDQGLSDKTASNHEDAVKSFLTYHEIRIKSQRRSNARKYKRAVYRKEEIRKLYEASPDWRGKTLIILAFQTGMDISSMLRLNYGDVSAAIENDKQYHVIEYTRSKTKTKAKAVIGKDSIDTLRQYVRWQRERGEELFFESPLFGSVRNLKVRARISKRTAQLEMRKTIVKAGIPSTKYEGKIVTFQELKEYGKFNPYGFHAIRKAFSSVAKQWMPFEQVKMSMGQTLPYDGAYDEYTEKEMIKNFKNAEPYLSISIDTRELEEQVREESELVKQLEERLKSTTQERDVQQEKLEALTNRFEILEGLFVKILEKETKK
ncbi:tyrosine-type recombinase/integrase [Candidatus Borrarchaeum sp.]|uniref:tyrosine-type recombinase/integrase n=1 Tax=Candidatus Borrarchaeum sp. TaxID=2846742 RepID=UPI0025799064|nr:tyrosine-type recombinase/integrase [Candidatus Borrarchaeum sp.]